MTDEDASLGVKKGTSKIVVSWSSVEGGSESSRIFSDEQGLGSAQNGDCQTVHRNLLPILPTEPECIPQPVRPKLVPLDEEIYTTAVSKIIQRDFFSDLPKLRLQKKIIDALDSLGRLDEKYYNSIVNVEAIEDYKIPLNTSYPTSLKTIQTTELMSSSLNAANNNSTQDLIATITDQTKPVTSETQSVNNFYMLSPHGKSNNAKHDHHSFAFDSTPYGNTTFGKAERINKYLDVSKVSLTVLQNKYTSEDNASFSNIIERNKLDIEHRFKRLYSREKNLLRLADTPESEFKLLSQRNIVDAWPTKVKNSLIYYPDGVPFTKYDGINNSAAPKKINYHATSFNSPSPIISQHTPKPPHPQQSPLNYSHTPKAHDYVPLTPSLIPNKDVDPNELVTWGQIESTPIPLDEHLRTPHSSAPHYEMLPTPRRDLVGYKLSKKDQPHSKLERRKLNKVHRSSIFESPAIMLPDSTISTTSSTYNFKSHRAAELSPSARTLLERIRSRSIRSHSNKNLFSKRRS